MGSPGLKSCSDEEFIRVVQDMGALKASQFLGVSERSIYRRLGKVRQHHQVYLPSQISNAIEHPDRVCFELKNGSVLIGSDFHIWPGNESTALRAFKKICKDVQPKAIILNGDVLDFPSISRHPPMGWESIPAPFEEIECVQDHLSDVEQAAPRGSKKVWTLGNHDCLDTQTECLTRRGWLKYDEINDDDEVLSLDGDVPVWSKINERVSYPYTGEMVRVEKTRVSMSVTPNHRVLLKRLNWKSKKFDIQEYRRADDLPFSFDMPTSGQSVFEGVSISDDAISLVGWLLTDGCYDKCGISIYQSKIAGKAEIERILNSLGIQYSRYDRQRTKASICGRALLKEPLLSSQFFIKAKSIPLIKAWLPQKGRLPEWCNQLSGRQFQVLLDALVAGDGCWDGYKPESKTCCVLYGAEPILSSIQSVAACHGWRARLAIDNRGDYRLCLTKEPKIRVEKPEIFREFYSGVVWCLRVPFENFMVRRNGCAFFTGNSRFEMKLATFAKEYKNIKGIHLSDHFNPCWEKGWSTWINNEVVCKHRWKGGIHATHNNTLNSGKTMVTGHLHSQKVTPFTDYNGTRYGIDTGCVADPYHPAFSYAEDNPRNWISGFAVLTFKDGRLLQPELASVWDKNSVQFRGSILRV